jgi:putative holliday junction resolvase
MARILAFDIGEKRVGIAVSDAAGRVASPVKVLSFDEVIGKGPALRRLIEDYEPELFLFGLPLSLSGAPSVQTDRVRASAAMIAAAWERPFEFCDERLSSVEAKRILREDGLDERRQRGKVDMIAASIFLQTFLDGRHLTDDCTDGMETLR